MYSLFHVLWGVESSSWHSHIGSRFKFSCPDSVRSKGWDWLWPGSGLKSSFFGWFSKDQDLPLSIDSRLKFFVWDFKKFKNSHIMLIRHSHLSLGSNSLVWIPWVQNHVLSDILTVGLDSSPLVQILWGAEGYCVGSRRKAPENYEDRWKGMSSSVDRTKETLVNTAQVQNLFA